jgi:hypothetical protein
MGGLMGNQRTQVAEPNVKFGVALPEVSKVDTYSRPTSPPSETTVDPMAKFFAEISPTLQAGIERRTQIAAEVKDQEILEKAKQKRVGDVESIFSSPEAFNNHAEDYNSLTLTAQNTLGKMYGAKLANKAINDIDNRAETEHWEKYSPDQVERVLQAAHGNVLTNIQTKTPEAAAMPGFSGIFSDMMESHQKQYLNEHSPKYGKYLTDTVKTASQSITLSIAQNKQWSVQKKGAEIGKQLEVLFKNVDPRGSYNFNEATVDALIQTDDINLLKAVMDGRAEISLGAARKRGEKTVEGNALVPTLTLNKTVYAQSKIPDAIRSLQKKQFEAHDEMHKMVDMRVQGVEMFMQQTMLSSTQTDQQGRPVLRGKPDTSFNGYSTWYLKEFGDDGNMASKNEFTYGYAIGRRRVESTLPMDGAEVDKAARIGASIESEEERAAYFRSSFRHASPTELNAMKSQSSAYRTETTDPSFLQLKNNIQAKHATANSGLNDKGIAQNFRVMEDQGMQFLHAVGYGNVEEAISYVDPKYYNAVKTILKRGNLQNLRKADKDYLIEVFEYSYHNQHPNVAELWKKPLGKVTTDNSDPAHPISHKKVIKNN